MLPNWRRAAFRGLFLRHPAANVAIDQEAEVLLDLGSKSPSSRLPKTPRARARSRRNTAPLDIA